MKEIVVLGAGESGTGAALLAQAKGYAVFVSDLGEISNQHRETLEKAGIPFEQGSHDKNRILSAQEIIKSPGIPDHVPLVIAAKELGISVVSEIEFASRYTNARFVAITGSNGKTTTTLLTYHLLKSAGLKVGLAGNIGTSLARQVIDDAFDIYVLELSSFQLDGMYEFKADVAVLTNITPDHLDRYNYRFENYVQSKFRILQNMDSQGSFITFLDDKVIRRELKEQQVVPKVLGVSHKERVLNGAYEGEGKMVFNTAEQVFSIPVDKLPLRGKHNEVNAMCAILAVVSLGVDQSVIAKSLGSFQNVPHRLEEVGVIHGVRYVNDSKATNVDAVSYALDSFEQPIIWIAGGVDKGNDYSELEELAYEKVKALICLGVDNGALIKAFQEKVDTIYESQHMDEVINIASEIADEGDVVLLSPACASFDLFKNYEDRGEQFKDAVQKLEENVAKL